MPNWRPRPIRGISVGVYSGFDLRQEIKTIAENSEARFAVVEDQEQVDKFLQIKDRTASAQKGYLLEL